MDATLRLLTPTRALGQMGRVVGVGKRTFVDTAGADWMIPAFPGSASSISPPQFTLGAPQLWRRADVPAVVRKLCSALTIVALAITGAGSALARAVPVRRIASAGSAAVGGGAAGGFAYLQSPTSLVVQEQRTRRVYGVSMGCQPMALARDAVALSCQGVKAALILRLASGNVTGVDIAANALSDGQPSGDVTPLALGTQWLLGYYTSPLDYPHNETATTVAVNWRTGATVYLGSADPLGPRAYPDLNAPGLRARLCAPTVRLPSDAGTFDDTRYAMITKAGPWILERKQDGFAVRRCGRLGDVLDPRPIADAALGTDTLATVSRSFAIKLENLTRGTTMDVVVPTTRPPTITFAGRHLLISVGEVDGSFSIYEAN